MEQWNFLEPWCTALKYRISYQKLECDVFEWDIERRHLKIYVPGRLDREHGTREEEDPLHYSNEQEYLAHFHKIREALLLLAAVAHVDSIAWKFLLLKYCKVNVGKHGEEKFQEEVPPKLVLYMDPYEVEKSDDEDGFDSDLVQFCGVYHHEHSSDEFQTALKSEFGR